MFDKQNGFTSVNILRDFGFSLTQEFLAMMLGVRRSGVSGAAGMLQREKLIEYHHGHLTILDHAGLQNRSCDCYAITKRDFDHLLGTLEKDGDKRTKSETATALGSSLKSNLIKKTVAVHPSF
jgi:hypothetical protein